MKRLLPFLLFFSAFSLFGMTYDSGGGSAGADQGDTLSGGTANAVMYTNSSKAITTGSALTFDGTKVGISTTSPTFLLDVNGTVRFSSNTVIDAYSDSFGAVTAASTSTVTWTEVTDRLGEFTTSSFTATLPGYYEIVAHSGVSQTAGTACFILKTNGTAITGGTVCNQGVTALASILDLSITRILNLSANDIVRIDASATTANATFQKMTFTVKRVP